MKSNKKLLGIISNVVAWILSSLSMIPLLLIIFNSLKDSNEASKMTLMLPSFPLHFENYSVVIEKGKLGLSLMNSLIYSCGSVLLCISLASVAAYVFSRNKTKLNKLLYIYIILGITMPVNYVALFKMMYFLHLSNTRLGIILLYTAFQLPFAVFLLYGFVSKIPIELDEAAVIDGCKPFQLFSIIILPLLKPAVATVIVLTFLNTWNEFTAPLYFLNKTSQWPMTLSVYNFFGMYFKDWNLVCADIFLTSLPVLIIYLVGQKYIVSGMTAGSVKG